MSDALDVLRSYARALARLTGAGAVSVYLPGTGAGEREVLVHEGALPPAPELRDAQAAAALAARAAPPSLQPLRLASAEPAAVLYRLPLSYVAGAPTTPGLERRRQGAGGVAESEQLWLGLRFEVLRPGSLPQAPEAGALPEEAWQAFLRLGAAVAAQARAGFRGHLDGITALPERREFQHELEAALAAARSGGGAMALLLLGPDEFGWVNERLDRRSGDRVLREIALRLRAAVRRHDHVARYGGAVLSVVLRGTTPEDGLLVASKVIGKLAQEPYHRRLFRLEFSAGVAGWPAEEPVDEHELVRRADQALSAARRGHAGKVRLWEKGSDVELARSLDRLQGIFTGEKAKDYRNMRLLLDTVAAVAASTDPEHLARSFTERLVETLHARRALVVQPPAGGTPELLAGLERGIADAPALSATDRALLERAFHTRDIAAPVRGSRSEPIVCALPLYLEDRCLGGILLEVSADEVSIQGADRLFLEALASEMAVALDRARLADLERQRTREERERLEAEVHDLRRVVHGSRLAYVSGAMESLLATARRVARTDTTVLITGESGTGKELLAHVLHGLSGRHERPLVVVDCSSISPSLIESELFGHERGAFTGAHARNPGRLAQAHGATVFLDEIGDLPLDLQSKLLRFVQEKQFTPVGGVAPRTVDARIIAATNVDLRLRVAQGRFREDLFHRLNVVRLHVPPLRERRDDIPHLADVFLKQFAALYRRPAHRFSPEAARALVEHSWPGNVRELQNAVLTSVLFCESPDIDLPNLHLHGPPVAGASTAAAPSAAPAASRERALEGPLGRLRQALAHEIAAAIASASAVPLGKWLDEDLVLVADRLSGGVSRKAAESLGIPETTYRRQLQRAQGAGGTRVRSESWPAVVPLLEELVLTRTGGGDLCASVEASLLSEIDFAVPGDVALAAALLGVTEATVLRRSARLRRS